MEIRLAAFDEQSPALYRKVHQWVQDSPHGFKPWYRKKVLTHAMNKYNVAWDEWDMNVRVHVGAVILDTIIHTTGLFTRETVPGKHIRDNKVYVVPTPEFMRWLEKNHQAAEVMHPPHEPMIEAPLAWTNLTDGGYHTRELRKPLMSSKHQRSSSARYTSDNMPTVFRAVNSLQSCPWKINRRVYQTALALWEGGADIPGMCERHDVSLPPKPSPEDRKAFAQYKRDSRAVWEHNTEQASLRSHAMQILVMSRKFEAYPSIWFPTFLDFRGRMYTQVKFLNPQGCDLSKGLLTFSNAVEPGESGMYWLKVHTANSFGVDKVSYADRVAWVDENMARIRAVGADPLAERWWMEADAPFQFLAACFALVHPEDAACLPVKMDGSCNGIQHLAAMTRDQVAGALVNLVPGDKPSGIYTAVASKTTELLKADGSEMARQWVEYGIDRSMAKRPTMILPYNGTARAFAHYIEDEVKDREKKGQSHPFGKRLTEACRLLSGLMKKAMDVELSGPCSVMMWTRKISKLCSKQKQPIEWSTPSGFIVSQAYTKSQAMEIRVRSEARTVKLIVRKPLPLLDARKQATALAPNKIHSFDAANVHLWLAECANFPGLSANHDEIGCHAAYRAKGAEVIARQFVGMYAKGDALVNFAADATRNLGDVKIPEPPPNGTLDLQAVLKSPYFFG
jgi:DNA-directed RNA polymerase